MNGAVFHRLLRIHKEPQGTGRPYVKNNADKLRQNHSGKDTEGRSLFRPSVLLCTQILADKGGEDHRHAHNRQKHKALYLCIGALPGNRIGPESVDIALNHNIPHADYRILDARRKSLTEHLRHDILIKLQFAEIQTDGLVRLPAHPHKA